MIMQHVRVATTRKKETHAQKTTSSCACSKPHTDVAGTLQLLGGGRADARSAPLLTQDEIMSRQQQMLPLQRSGQPWEKIKKLEKDH